MIHKYEVVTWFVYKIQSFKFKPTTFTKKVTVLINACQHSQAPYLTAPTGTSSRPTTITTSLLDTCIHSTYAIFMLQ
jgi:hypothetical protein